MNAISLTAQHPNSETRIEIMHKFDDNPTTSSPYDNFTAQTFNRPQYYFYQIFPLIYNMIHVGFQVIIFDFEFSMIFQFIFSHSLATTSCLDHLTSSS